MFIKGRTQWVWKSEDGLGKRRVRELWANYQLCVVLGVWGGVSWSPGSSRRRTKKLEMGVRLQIGAQAHPGWLRHWGRTLRNWPQSLQEGWIQRGGQGLSLGHRKKISELLVIFICWRRRRERKEEKEKEGRKGKGGRGGEGEERT